MKIQIVSDIHIEMYREEIDPMTFVQPTGEYLALCGDIGAPGKEKQFTRYKTLLEKYSEHFKHVFVLTGNHEYYIPGFNTPEVTMPTVPEIDVMIEELCNNFDNVTFLQMKSVVVDGIKVIGATLWSEVTNVNAVQNGLQDYRMIYLENENIEQQQPKKKKRKKQKKQKRLKQRSAQVADTCAWHKEHLEYIMKEVKAAREVNHKCVILTHHAPVIKKSSHPKHENNSINSAFCTDLKHIIESEEFDHVKLWAYGHTHYNASRTVGKTLVMANQKGYFFEKDVGKPYEVNNCINID